MDVNVNFVLNDDNPEQAQFVVNKDITFDADMTIETSVREHSLLTGRDKLNQHPISSITGLEVRLRGFVFEQGIPAKIWYINHNLGKRPSCVVVDTAGSVQIPDEVVYNDENNITAYFISEFAGQAFLD